MARKRQHQDQELPFVALMDTMTNVVGVLTIVLVMIGLSLASAVSKVFSSLPPSTPEQVAELKAEVDKLREESRPDEERFNALNKPDLTPEQSAVLDKELIRLEQTAKDKGIKVLASDSLLREQAKRDAELKAKKEAMDKLLAERDRVKALLDDVPVAKAPPPKVVRLPAGKPIPEGAEFEYFLVSSNGAHWVDVEGAKEAFLREFRSSALRDTIKTKVKRGDKTVNIYDHVKLKAYFATRRIPFREFRMEVTFATWTTSPILRLIPTAPAGGLQNDLRRIKSNPKAVAMFNVIPQAFDQYLAVREYTDDIGVPAGWQLIGEPVHQITVSDIETTQPKVVPPATPPPATGPGTIKAPTRTLD